MARDLTQVTSKGFFQVEGVYDVKIVSTSEDKTKNGYDKTVFDVETDEGLAGKVEFVWTDKSMGYIKGTLLAMGIDVNTQAFEPLTLVGQYFQVKVSFKMQQTKDAFGNVTGASKSQYPDINFVGPSALNNMAATPVTEAQPMTNQAPIGVLPSDVPQAGQQPVQQPMQAPVQQPEQSQPVIQEVPQQPMQAPVQQPIPQPQQPQIPGAAPLNA